MTRIAELVREARVMGSDAARAIGRFRKGGTLGYSAATAPETRVRATRAEAVEDERSWLEGCCMRCLSEEWTWRDYRGCSNCFEPEEEL